MKNIIHKLKIDTALLEMHMHHPFNDIHTDKKNVPPQSQSEDVRNDKMIEHRDNVDLFLRSILLLSHYLQ